LTVDRSRDVIRSERYVHSVPPLEFVTLRRPSGLITLGAPFAHALERLRAGDGIYRAMFGWAELAGDEERIHAQQVTDECRRSFAWEDIAARASRALAAGGFSYRAAIAAERQLTELALLDDWPAAIERVHDLLGAYRSTTTPAATSTLQGLLWLMAQAITNRWPQPAGRLGGQAAELRFARLAMIASSLGPDGITAFRVRAPGSCAPERQLPTTMALLGAGRLAERDTVIRWVVRAVELYDELLDVPDSARLGFATAKGVDIRTWIVKLCSLAALVEEQGRVRFDLRAPPDMPTARDVVSIARALSRSAEEHAQRLREGFVAAPNQMLAFQSFREKPLLDLGEDQFLLLHKDFMLAASDDGVWYTLSDLVGESFRTRFGQALEEYVARVLTRIAGARGGALARVPPDPRAPRCDFALRLGDDLALIDAKRTGLNALQLMGDASAARRLHEELGRGCAQILSTKRDIDEGRLDEVLVALGKEPSWRPMRCFPLLVTHRPVFVVFSSAEHLVRSQGLAGEWETRLSAWPSVWALQDLELFEAAAADIDVEQLFSAAANREPIVTAGVSAYLTHVGYSGPVASPYYDARRREILGPFVERLQVTGTSPSPE